MISAKTLPGYRGQLIRARWAFADKMEAIFHEMCDKVAAGGGSEYHDRAMKAAAYALEVSAWAEKAGPRPTPRLWPSARSAIAEVAEGAE